MENEKKMEKISATELLSRGKLLSSAELFSVACKRLENEDLSIEDYELIKNSMGDLRKRYKELAEIDKLDNINPVDSKSMMEALSSVITKVKEKIPSKESIVENIKKIPKLRIIVKKE